MANEKNYQLLLKLSNFIGANIQEIENNDGVMERCLVIPIDKNGLVVTKFNTVYCDAYAFEKTFGCSDDNTHYLRQRLSKENRERLAQLGYKTPYLGSMKPTNFKFSYTDSQYGNGGRVKKLDDNE